MKKKTGSVLYIFLALLLIIGIVVGALYFTNGGTTEPRLFDIKLNNVNVDGLQIEMSSNDILEFVIISKLGSKKPDNLQLKIVPNDLAKNVRFTIENREYNLYGLKDLSGLFNVTYDDNKIKVSTDWNLIDFLVDYYVTTSDLVTLNDYKESAFSFIDLHFCSSDLVIKCSLIQVVFVTEILFDKDNVIFNGGYND